MAAGGALWAASRRTRSGGAGGGERDWAPAAAGSAPGPSAAAAEVIRLRRERAADRRRVRRAHTIARRAERLVAMARCLAGARLVELAARGTQAVVDNFAAESAALWVLGDGRAELIASAARSEARWAAADRPDAAAVHYRPPRARAGGSVHYLPLRSQAREPVGCLVVGFDPPRGQRPPGLDTYVALLGSFVAAELGTQAAGFAPGGVDDRAA
jgi:hypothetical protein